MSDSLALQASHLTAESGAMPATRTGVMAVLKALLESLVSAQTRSFENTGPLRYRIPPI